MIDRLVADVRRLLCCEPSQHNPLRRVCPRFFAHFQGIQLLDLHEAIATRDYQTKRATVFRWPCAMLQTSSDQPPSSPISGQRILNSPALVRTQAAWAAGLARDKTSSSRILSHLTFGTVQSSKHVKSAVNPLGVFLSATVLNTIDWLSRSSIASLCLAAQMSCTARVEDSGSGHRLACRSGVTVMSSDFSVTGGHPPRVAGGGRTPILAAFFAL